MADIFDEVEEEVRQERYLAWLRRYGPYVIGAVLLGLGLIGGWRLYQGWRAGQDMAASERFQAAAEQVTAGDKAGEAALQQMSDAGPATYRAFALAARAQTRQQAGDLAGAIALLDRASAATSDPLLRDTARLRAAYLVAETQDFTALDRRLQPLIEAGGPLSYLARELRGIEAWEAGRLDIARESLEGLTLALAAPAAVRQRAQAALAVIGPAPSQTPAAPTPAPATSGASR